MDEVDQTKDYAKTFDEIIETGNESGKKNHIRVTEGLKKIDTKYVIFLQEDMLLNAKVDTDLIKNLSSVLEKKHAGAIRLNSMFQTDYQYDENLIAPDIIEYPRNMPYRVSYAPSIWNRDFLYRISSKFEYGADFERLGTQLMRNSDVKMLGYRYTAYPYMNGILRGKWEIPTVRFLNYHKIVPDYNAHPLMNSKDELKMALQGYIFNLNPHLVLNLQTKMKIGVKKKV